MNFPPLFLVNTETIHTHQTLHLQLINKVIKSVITAIRRKQRSLIATDANTLIRHENVILIRNDFTIGCH